MGDDGLKEMCVKSLYAGLVKASRQTSGYTMQGINLMKNSAGEVVGMEGMDKVGYQAGFNYIRQLAVHLRNSITNNSKVPPLCITSTTTTTNYPKKTGVL